ncbi:MAG: ATP-binding protein, partial [Longimonas sp.]|uniref:sensor histidine kinase n=1 Tax=Longimonas sp. TaxID=2039626 RepID=UPI0039765688
PLDQALCNTTIRTPGLMVVEDARHDPRFKGNPFVAGPPHLRFYMSMPLTSPDGFRVGTLCVMDTKPRSPSTHDQETIKKLAQVVMDELEMRATESQRAYRELYDREQRLRNLANSIPGVVFRMETNTAPNGTPRYDVPFISEYARNLLGYPLDERGTTGAFTWFVARVHPDHRKPFLDSVVEAIRTGTPWRHDIPFQMDTGAIRWIRGVAVPEQGPNGLTMNGVLLDSTAEKKAEAALRESKEKAEEMSRLKSAFLTNMSHEVRTPLAAIIGFADVLNDLDLKGPADKFSTLMRRSSQRLLDTLNAVLELSQLEASVVDLQPTPLSIAATLHDVVASFRARANENDITLELKRPSSDVEGVTDRQALTRILTHLIDNAIKFTPAGGTVTVRLSAAEDALTFTVADTGVGIENDMVPQIFAAFQQASTGCARSHEGSGLGLTITKHLVELMQGAISVDTAPDTGTTVRVRLPRRPVPNAVTTDPAQLRY